MDGILPACSRTAMCASRRRPLWEDGQLALLLGPKPDGMSAQQLTKQQRTQKKEYDQCKTSKKCPIKFFNTYTGMHKSFFQEKEGGGSLLIFVDLFYQKCKFFKKTLAQMTLFQGTGHHVEPHRLCNPWNRIQVPNGNSAQRKIHKSKCYHAILQTKVAPFLSYCPLMFIYFFVRSRRLNKLEQFYPSGNYQ